MKLIMRLLFALSAITWPMGSWAQDLWVGKDGNVRSSDIRAMVVAGDAMYLATRSEVYRSSVEKQRWESVFALPQGENEITCAACWSGGIYVGTRRGVMATRDGGATWLNVFRTIVPEKSDISCIAVSGDGKGRLMVGGQRGIYLSEDGGRAWHDVGEVPGSSRVTGIAFAEEGLYAAADSGIFCRLDGSDGWDRVNAFGPRPGSIPEEDPQAPSGSEEEEAAGGGFVAVSGPRIYAGSAGRISFTADGGKSWADLPAGGLSGNINCILPLQDPEAVYCGTTKGVFLYIPDKSVWRELYKGFDRPLDVRSVVLDEGTGSLWAVTGRGLFKFEAGRFVPDEPADPEKAAKAYTLMADDGPPFAELQKAAMEYNDVTPEKIKRWQAESRMSALIPKINIGMDNSTSNTYEIYTSATKDYIVSGPDDISKGVDLSVSWELGKLIWSDDQTNIDVRSRLNTQLRNDILDDLRRAYYERKRLRYELMMSPPVDPKSRVEKDLRIEELTQTINDITGNYMLRQQK